MRVSGINFIYEMNEQNVEVLAGVSISFYKQGNNEYLNGSVVITLEQYLAAQGKFTELENLVWERIQSYIPEVV